MREGIHPNYVLTAVTCACGSSFQTRSTKPNIHLEICSSCHPFFTGKQKLMDSAGRVERFTRRFEKTSGKTVRVKAQTKAAKAVPSGGAKKILSTGARKVKPVESKKTKKESAPKSK